MYRLAKEEEYSILRSIIFLNMIYNEFIKRFTYENTQKQKLNY
jgi:hypothetical protein